MPVIAANSIIDPRARLADDVEVGPHCVIAGDVTLAAGTRLLHSVHLQGPLTIGRDNVFYPFCCVGFPPQDRKFDPGTPGSGTRIGDRNVFRESVTIHRATGAHPTTIGDDNYFMVNSHAGHDAVVGNRCTLANGALLAGHVRLFDDVTLGGGSALHQFCRMGRLSMMSGVVAVAQDVPPFCIAYNMRSVGSLNIVGLRRAGYRRHIKPLQRAFDILYRESHANAEAADAITTEWGDDPLCVELAEFIRTTKRGLCPYGGGAAHVES